MIKQEIRRNTYLIEDKEGNVLGTFNSRQIKLHREARYKTEARINMIRCLDEVQILEKDELANFVNNFKKGNEIKNLTVKYLPKRMRKLAIQTKRNSRRAPTEESET